MLRDRGRGCSLYLCLNAEVVLGLARAEENGLVVGHRGGRGAVVSESVRDRILVDGLECLPCDGDRLVCRLCPLCD